METIKTYLENMFSHLPATPEVLRAKEELLSMMEDKYNELKSEGRSENESIGIVISEFGNLDELAATLGLEDYSAEPSAQSAMEPARKVSMDEAKRYIEMTLNSARRIAIGVMLCILSPIPLLILGALSEGEGYNENLLGVSGVIVLLGIIAIAVAVFIMNSSSMASYEYIKKEHISLDYPTKQFVSKEQLLTKPRRTMHMTIGVMLFILAAVPVLLLGVIDNVTGLMGAVAVSFTLLLVSIGTFLCIFSSEIRDSYSALLEEGSFTSKSTDKTLAKTVGSIYWPVITCIYLAYSFWTHDWGRSWIIWPVAAVLSAAIDAVCNMIEKK